MAVNVEIQLFDYLVFVQRCSLIDRYSKDETLKPGDEELLRYSHLLVEQRNKFPYDDEDIHATHDFLEHINCFHSIGLEYQSYFPVKIKTRPCMGIAKRKKAFARPFEEPVVLQEQDDPPKEDVIEQFAINVESFDESQPQEDFSGTLVADEKNDSTGGDEDVSVEEDRILSEEADGIDDDGQSYGRKTVISDEFEGDEDESYTSMEQDRGSDEVSDIPFELFENMVNSEEIYDIFSKEKNSEEAHEQPQSPNIEVDNDKSKPEVRQRAKQTKIKLRKVIELYYQSRGQVIEAEPNMPAEIDLPAPKVKKPIEVQLSVPRKPSTKINIKNIIKAEKIKQLVERISKLDLKAQCDLEILSAKDCLIKLIDEFDKE